MLKLICLIRSVRPAKYVADSRDPRRSHYEVSLGDLGAELLHAIEDVTSEGSKCFGLT
jgi:hypothetical protein